MNPDIKIVGGGKGAEDALCYLRVGECIYQLAVFPLREYPSEFGFRGKPPTAFYPGKDTLAIFNGRLVNPDGSPGRQHTGLGLVNIKQFITQGAGDACSDLRVERSLSLGRKAQAFQKEYARKLRGELQEITASVVEELDVGRALTFAYEGLTLEFVGSEYLL